MFKNTVKGILVSSLVLGGMVAGAMVANPTNAQASSYSTKRNNSVKLVWRKSMGRHAFKANKGALYSKHLGYKYANLSAYPNTTWYTIGHEKLHNKAKGTNPIYYKVVSANGKHTGWVYRGYLKKVSTSKASSSKKTDNYYKNLANQMTKDARKKASSTTGTKTSTKPNTNTNSGSKTPSTKPSTPKTPNVPKMSEAQYNSEVASAMLSALNAARTKAGLAPATNEPDSRTQMYANARVPQILSQQVRDGGVVLDHTYGANGDLGTMVIKNQLGLKGILPEETLAGDSYSDSSSVMTHETPEQVGTDAINNMVYHDEAMGNGHRDTLLGQNFTHVGIGVGQAYGKVLMVTEGDSK